MTWKPIESAPKDGTPILVFGVNLYSNLAHMGVRQFNLGTWDEPNIDGYEFEDDLRKITHWMPLPAPPEAT